MIEIDPHDDASRRLWHAVGELTAFLPEGWTLVGGLMVQLHAAEHGTEDVRVTVDIDILGQARPPGPLPAIDRALTDAGFEAHPPDPDNYGFRYERDGLIVDVLAPTGSVRRRRWTGHATRSESPAARRRSRAPRPSRCGSTGTSSSCDARR
jgi:hypothetical protein